jgi:hypothetical protein
VGRRFRRWALPAFAFVLVVGYIVWRTPHSERIYSTANGVTEITLVTEGFPSNGQPLPVMGLGYARWVNFERVVYNGETYEQVGSGATVIRREAQPTRYLVKERLRVKPTLFEELRFATVTIEDVQSASVLAKKEWRCNHVECRISSDDSGGWPGQYAALFVRKVLNENMEIGGPAGTKPYPKTVAQVHPLTPSTPRSIEQLQSRAFGCSKHISVFVRKDINQMVVSDGTWTYVPAHLTHQVHCLPSGLFIVSSTFPNDVFLDWVSYSGELMGQFHVAGRMFHLPVAGQFNMLLKCPSIKIPFAFAWSIFTGSGQRVTKKSRVNGNR